MVTEESIKQFSVQCSRIFEETGKDMIGQSEVVENTIVALIAGGNVLLEGVPGVGKTRLVRTLSRVFNLPFSRIQFTPDLMPADVTGTNIITKDEKGNSVFRFEPGPIFANLVLADEINRTSSKTQAALLEVMEEGKVTVDNETHPVPQPFVVIATENPTGSSGTQMLPESQLDRFMISLSMGYPDHENLVELLRDRQTTNPLEKATAVITKEEVVMLQDQVQKVYMADSILNYIATLAEATRNHPMITLGLSPRGTLALCRMTKAAAFMEERDYVIPEDVKRVFTDVTAHRMILDSRARYQEQSAKDILEEILKDTEAPKVEGE